jgi:hypothetical protein
MTYRASASKQPAQNLNWLIGGGLAGAAFILYLLTLAPTVLEADGGEFQFVPWLPGIAHPTGYPLYTLLGWAWTHVFPVGEVAWRMNLLSAIFAAITVGVTYGVARQLLDAGFPDTPHLARIVGALMAAATFAVIPTFWSQAIIAEVYALHALFVALILWLALKWGNENCSLGSRTGKLLALTFGLSLTHHRTTVLLLPALILFYWWYYRDNLKKISTTRVSVRLVLIYGLLLVGPLCLYLYLPVIAPATPYATLTLSDTQTLVLYDNSLRGFWEHVMGNVFTGELRPTAAGLDRLRLTWQFLLEQVGWTGVVMGVAGLVFLWRHRQMDLLLLTGLGFLAFITFNLIYFIGDIFVLFIPAWLIVCLWIGLGVLGTADLAAKHFVRRKTAFNPTPAFRELRQRLGQGIYGLVVIGVVFVLVFFMIVDLAMRNTKIAQQNIFLARDRWQAVLDEPIPEAAILLSNDRNEMMPMWYYQYVEQRRPDLLGLFPLVVTDPAYANIGRVLDQALASGRPVYLIKPMDGLGLKADLRPAGMLFRASTIETEPTYWYKATLPEVTVQSTSDITLTETIRLLGYDVRPTEFTAGDEITVTLYWQPVQPLTIDYTSFVHLVNNAGQGITQSDHKPGGDFYPSTFWQVAEVLRDEHTLTIPPDAPTGQYRLRVGMYYQPQPGQVNGMGSGVEVGLLTLED